MTVAQQELAIRELGKRYSAGTFGHFLMLVTGWLFVPNALPFSYLIPGALFGALIPLRIYTRHLAMTRPWERRRAWTLFAIGTFGSNLLWGVLVAVVQSWKGGLDPVVFAFFTCGISFGSVAALAPSRWLQYGALVLMLVPAIVSAVLGHGLPVFAAVHAIFLAYTFVMGRAATKEFWQIGHVEPAAARAGDRAAAGAEARVRRPPRLRDRPRDQHAGPVRQR